MVGTFLSHISRRFFRSPSAGKDTAVKFGLAFIVVLLAGYSLTLGFALERIIVDGMKQRNAISFLNGLLIYYFIGGFVTRYLIQSLPVLDVQPYLHLPVSRGKIIHFLLGKSVLHVFNFFVFFLFTPFALNAITREYGLIHGCMWLLSLWFISLINHFLVILVKKYFTQSVWGVLIFFIICALFSGADYFGWLKLSLVSEKIFQTVLRGYTTVVLLLTLVMVLYYAAYRTFIHRLYPEELSVKESQIFNSPNWAFLQSFGLMGAWISVELKLIFRNRRSREIFLMHVVFLLMPLAFYAYTKNREAYGAFLFFGVISSGFFTMNYGMFLFSWQGAHFDFTLVKPSSIRQFVESKYWLLAATTAFWFLFSIPFFFLGWHFLLINLVASLYNIGINIFVAMNMSMWGAKRMDLKHPGSLNIEGAGAAQWLMSVPLMAGPYLFYAPFSLMGLPIPGLLCVGIAGLMGILFRQKFIDLTFQRLFNRRHVLASSFRND